MRSIAGICWFGMVAGALSAGVTSAVADDPVVPYWITPAAAAANAPAPAAPAARAQTEADEYTRYDLLQPDSSQFRISFEVTATTAGATSYFNPIRKGSEASDEAVSDRTTGKPLSFALVSGADARREGFADAELEVQFLRVRLPRPVPADGGIRLLIDKTYKDSKSYYRKGADRIVFARPLGVRRNSVVLPAGYELVSCNLPSQVLPQPDGRTMVSFMHPGPEAAPLVVEARRLPGVAVPASSTAAATPRSPAPRKGPALASAAAPQPAPSTEERLEERAHQDRTIVYLLRQPESHAFDLYHDYTETREGTDKYLNVVRKGSASSDPAARILDTGETLRVETLRGDALRHAGLTAAELSEVAGEATVGAKGGTVGGTASAPGAVAPDTEVVIAHFPPLRKGESLRLRISETYTDPRSYRLDGERLVFDRTFGRPRDAVVLPAGWALTASTIPGTVSETADGRIRLDFINPRLDDIAVLIEARRRPPSTGGDRSPVPAPPP
jgi:hypothetical protein